MISTLIVELNPSPMEQSQNAERWEDLVRYRVRKNHIPNERRIGASLKFSYLIISLGRSNGRRRHSQIRILDPQIPCRCTQSSAKVFTLEMFRQPCAIRVPESRPKTPPNYRISLSPKNTLACDGQPQGRLLNNEMIDLFSCGSSYPSCGIRTIE